MRGKFSSWGLAHCCWLCFNEARALCAGSLQTRESKMADPVGFNEARALCAGSCSKHANEPQILSRFNEARALCAGSWPPGAPAGACGALASMRPAHYAREVSGRAMSVAAVLFSFNEARALCAGSWPLRKPAPQAPRGRPLRELSVSARPSASPSRPWGPMLTRNSLILKEQLPNASGGRETEHDLSARNGAAGYTMIGSRATGA